MGVSLVSAVALGVTLLEPKTDDSTALKASRVDTATHSEPSVPRLDTEPQGMTKNRPVSETKAHQVASAPSQEKMDSEPLATYEYLPSGPVAEFQEIVTESWIYEHFNQGFESFDEIGEVSLDYNKISKLEAGSTFSIPDIHGNNFNIKASVVKRSVPINGVARQDTLAISGDLIAEEEVYDFNLVIVGEAAAPDSGLVGSFSTPMGNYRIAKLRDSERTFIKKYSPRAGQYLHGDHVRYDDSPNE